MKRKIREVLLGGLAGILISGCANLPNIYRNNLTVNSQAYKKSAKKELYQTRNIEERARLKYMLNDFLGIDSKNFAIRVFTDKNKKIAYSKWKSQNPREILIYLNGLESHSGWFSEPANQLTEKGIVVYGLDRRGSGLNTRIKGGSQDWLKDLDKMVEIAKNENPNIDINLASLCFGARLSTSYAIKNQEKISSLIYISPGFDMKVGLNFLELGSIILDCFGIQTNTQSPIKNNEMFTSNSDYLEFLKKDRLRTYAPNSDTYIKGENLLKQSLKDLDKIKIPSLVLLAFNDSIINIEKTKKTIRKFGKKPEIIEYPTEHTIFFDGECIMPKFIKDIIEFIE